MTKVDDIERDIARQRQATADSVAAVQEKLTPAGLLEDILTTVGIEEKRRKTLAHEMVDTVARNPLPLAVIAIGVGWLFYEAVRNTAIKQPSREVVVRPATDVVPVPTHHQTI